MNALSAALLVYVLFSCVSCTEAPEGRPSHLLKGEITGRYYQNEPIGQWTYYDETKRAIKEVFYFDSTGRTYEARYFDTKGKVVYLERMDNGVRSFQKPRVEGIEQGELLFQEYCRNCHGLHESFVGPALYPAANDQPAASFSHTASNRYHRSKYLSYEIPVTLSEQDFGLIYEYVRKRGIAIN